MGQYMKINTALFGFGRIGQMHADNLNHHKSFNLKYIFDIDKKIHKKIESSSIRLIDSIDITFTDYINVFFIGHERFLNMITKFEEGTEIYYYDFEKNFEIMSFEIIFEMRSFEMISFEKNFE